MAGLARLHRSQRAAQLEVLAHRDPRAERQLGERFAGAELVEKRDHVLALAAQAGLVGHCGLRIQGLSDHEIAAVLGLAKVRSVDLLLQRHGALDAQRAVREWRPW